MSEKTPTLSNSRCHISFAQMISNTTSIIVDVATIVDAYNPELYIFHLSQDILNDYDTYSDCIVVASNVETARTISPDGDRFKDGQWSSGRSLGSWPNDPRHVQVGEIGILTDKTKKEGDVICASFRAG